MKYPAPKLLLLFAICSALFSCQKRWSDEIAANEAVATFMENFEGRGDLTDPLSRPTSPEDAIKAFETAEDLSISLVLSEPEIVQPLEINFDHKGRLWVVQYNQYPYPKGLKVTAIDNHTRVIFDRVPDAPPAGAKGADKITFFEDTNGDGIFDKSTDAITGLNIATSAALGRGKIWVLNPPYLLAYPDADNDGIPNGEPEVHASGFGLEDTHSVANSLTWGPDGWLYGVQGSTTTATINTKATKNLRFLGQAIWRYNPETTVFEVFAEGGGNNPFHLEFDSKGRIFSGSNGSGRGPYYKQGGYYIKSWGKHGPLTNPYAFGYLPTMPLDGDTKRFTHGLIRYEGGALPDRYTDKMFAVNPLHNFIQLTRFEPWGSSYKNIDEEIVLSTPDRWFRPIDIKLGPDGAIYLTDWYDSRLSHVDPRDTWHKTSGRIYRLGAKGTTIPLRPFDLSQYSSQELVSLLSHENKWYRQQAQRLFADRKDRNIIPELLKVIQNNTGQIALEALWAVYLSGGWSDSVALQGLSHTDPFVRMWSVRYLGDQGTLSPEVSQAINKLAANELHPEVRSQLASSAKRLDSSSAFPLIKILLAGSSDLEDPDIPLLIWWAIESKAHENHAEILKLFSQSNSWKWPMVEQTVLKRLAQRWIMTGEKVDMEACAALLRLAPSEVHEKLLVEGIMEGLRGTSAASLPKELAETLETFQKSLGTAPLTLALRQGNQDAIKESLAIISDRNQEISLRLSYIEIMGEINPVEAAPALLTLVEKDPSSAIKQSALHALQGYPNYEIGEKIASIYPGIRADSYVREAAISLFATRAEWAKALFNEIENSRIISPDDVPIHLAQNFSFLEDPTIKKRAETHWPGIRPATATEKTNQINALKAILTTEKGDEVRGKSIYVDTCGACHRMKGSGGIIGPELTGYDRKNLDYMLLHIVDPNADIREGYETYQIQTKDGRLLVGSVASQSGGTIELMPIFGNKRTVIPEERILTKKIQQVSSMPERTLSTLTEEEVKDLFAYLMQD
ncbi:MAG TPA: PVC-type heme-binding CxxCH protein [Lunatimonas sp.]|nr:PVC-type heme-binding CxxCH protein [Lunatimonas sp.]